MNVDELVGLLSHFEMSWHTLRQHLVYESGTRLDPTAFRGQDPIAVMKAAVACRRQIVDAMVDEVVDAIGAAANAQFVRDKISGTRCRIDAGAVTGYAKSCVKPKFCSSYLSRGAARLPRYFNPSTT